MMGGLNSSNTAETAVYSAQSLVKGDPEWKLIAANGWEESWPVYSQTGITMNSKIYFFGMFSFKVYKRVFPSFFSGGWNVAQYFDNVIVFDTETETWSEEGVMKVPRGRPGASVVSLDEVKEWATDCVTKEIPSKLSK